MSDDDKKLQVTYDIQKAVEGTKTIQRRMSDLSQVIKQNSALAEVTKQIKSLQDTLNATQAPTITSRRPEDFLGPRINTSISKAPVHETNERLASIDEKFEKAAESNDKAASKAILVGIGAIIIAFAMPAFQIIYNELWVSPRQEAQMNQTIESLKNQVSEMGDEHAKTIIGLVEALEKSSESNTLIVKKIQAELEEHRKGVSNILTEKYSP